MPEITPERYLDLTGLSHFLEKLDNRFATPADIKNAILTIQQNEETLGTFSANANTNVTVNIETPQVKRYI